MLGVSLADLAEADGGAFAATDGEEAFAAGVGVDELGDAEAAGVEPLDDSRPFPYGCSFAKGKVQMSSMLVKAALPRDRILLIKRYCWEWFHARAVVATAFETNSAGSLAE